MNATTDTTTLRLIAAASPTAVNVLGGWDGLVSAVADTAWTASWWDAHADQIRDRIRDGDPTLTDIGDDTIDAVSRTATATCGALFSGDRETGRPILDVDDVVVLTRSALAQRPAPDDDVEGAEMTWIEDAAVAAWETVADRVAAAWERRANRPPRYRQVRVDRDVHDDRGRLLVHAGEYADVVAWPTLGHPTIRVRNAHGQTLTLPVPRRFLACVPNR